MADPLFPVEVEPEEVQDEGFTIEEIALELAKGALASGAYKENMGAAVVWAWTDGIQSWIAGRDMFIKVNGLGSGNFTP